MMTWKDITLEKAIRLIKVDDKDELELVMRQLAICLDKTYDEIENMEPSKIFEEYNKWVFIRSLPEQKMVPTIKINGNKYGMIELTKLTMAQLVDIEEFYAGGFIDNIHRIMSVLFLPIKWSNPFTKKYKLEEYEYSEERANEFLNGTNMEFVWSNLLFFYHIEEAFINNLRAFLAEHQMTALTESKKRMEKLFQEVEHLKKSEQEKLKKE